MEARRHAKAERILSALNGKTFHDGYTAVDFLSDVLRRHELETLDSVMKETL